MSTELATPVATPSLVWSDALHLGMPVIDQTHEEFVELLAAAELADDEQLLERIEALQTHTVAHFGMEDRWMESTQFGPQHCHSGQHQLVLRTLQELLRCGHEDGDLNLVRSILPDLGRWFSQHAQTMDAMLTWHLGQIGFDPATGAFTLPPEPQEAAAQNSCGSCAA
jgi:hemerythrin-like metal-binding protein